MRYFFLLLLTTSSCILLTDAFAPVCGDGVKQGDEQCDDGNDDNTDNCLITCQSASCGDGALLTGVEVCDDGNANDTDSCLSSCQVATCGDNAVQAGVEGCDDGNNIDGDGCSAACGLESCGNGVIDNNEGCDDGNNVGGDGCSALCQPEGCGNGVIDVQEVCFTTATISVASFPSRVLTKELNNDNRDDFLVCSATALTPFLGVAGGSPTAGSSLTINGVSGNCTGLAVGDYNGGGLDVALGYNNGTNDKLVLVSDLNGAAAQTALDLGVVVPRDMVTLPTAGNDVLLVALNKLDVVRAFTNLPGTSTVDNATGAKPFGLVLDRFNGDGILDLASIETEGAATIFLGDGAGGFSKGTVTLPNGCLFGQSGKIDVGDSLDLLASCPGAGLIAIELNDGAGVFTPSTSLLTGLANGTAFAVVDLDGDTDSDIAIVDQGVAGQVKFFLNNGAGAFTENQSIAAGDTPTSIAFGNFNNDTLPDFVVTNLNSASLTLILSNP